MRDMNDMVSKTLQEITDLVSTWKIDADFEIRNLEDEQLRETMLKLLESYQRTFMSVMEKLLALAKEAAGD